MTEMLIVGEGKVTCVESTKDRFNLTVTEDFGDHRIRRVRYDSTLTLTREQLETLGKALIKLSRK